MIIKPSIAIFKESDCELDDNCSIEDYIYAVKTRKLSINNMEITVNKFDDFKKVVKWFINGDMAELPDLLETLEEYSITNV